MRVEDDLRTLPRGPSDGFRIAPAFMADRDTERERTGLKNAPPQAGRIGIVLRRIELDFILKSRDRSIAIDHHGRDPERAIDDAFRAENHPQIRLRGCRRKDGPCAFQEHRIGWRNVLPH
jgi:hypothetical protein